MLVWFQRKTSSQLQGYHAELGRFCDHSFVSVILLVFMTLNIFNK